MLGRDRRGEPPASASRRAWATRGTATLTRTSGLVPGRNSRPTKTTQAIATASSHGRPRSSVVRIRPMGLPYYETPVNAMQPLGSMGHACPIREGDHLMSTTSAHRTALITGASGGFGAEFARLFAADGFDLILVARSGAAMEEIAQVEEERHGISVTVLPKDLSRPGAARDVMASVEERGLRVDALVNNAGFSTYGPFVETDAQTMVDMLQVNTAVLTELTRACLPGMIGARLGPGDAARVDRLVHARAHDRRVRRDQVLRALARTRARRGAEGDGGERHHAVSGSDADRLPGPRRDARLQARSRARSSPPPRRSPTPATPR